MPPVRSELARSPDERADHASPVIHHHARRSGKGAGQRSRFRHPQVRRDVATLKPLDMATILESVAKTGRCVIVHEAARTAGMGAEIAAGLAEHGLLSLLAPVRRVTGYDVVVPLAKLENQYLPSVERILSAAREVLEFT